MDMVKALRWLILLSLTAGSAASAVAGESISLQLRWKHAFQFAGYYMAVEQGYYAQHGLDVTLLEGGPGKDPVTHILNGEGKYGISDTGIIMTRSEGQPIKALAAVFQHSPLVLAVKSETGIRSFSDLRNKRVMLQAGHQDAVILAAMQQAGIHDQDFIRQDTSFKLNDLIDGHTDAFSVYLTDQPHQLQDMGIAYRLLRPVDFGIDFYGDLLATSDRELNHHPERAEAFIEASLEGWNYALNHIDETIELILAKYNSQNLTREQLRFEAYKTSEMILKEVVSLGYMNKARWQKIIDTYAGLELIKPGLDLTLLLYSPEPSFSDFINQNRWYLALFALIALLLISGIYTLLLRGLVHHRTAALEESESRFRALVSNLPGIVFRGRNDNELSMVFISDEVFRVTGYPASDFIDNRVRSFASIIHPDDREYVLSEMTHAITTGQSVAVEYRIRHANGGIHWLHGRSQPAMDRGGQSEWIDGNIFDITERKLDEQLRNDISQTLEIIISETSLPKILEKIIVIYESRYPEMRGSILLLRDEHLYHGASPNLPKPYLDSIDGVKIGPMVGSCGTAAYRGKRIIVEDIDTHPLWAPYKHLAQPYGLHACWSEPILSPDGKVLGTFAMYYDHPCGPNPHELRDIANAARLAGVAIDREHNHEMLVKLQRAIEHSSEVVTILNRDGIIEYINAAYTRITGYPAQYALGKTPRLLRDPAQRILVEEIWLTLQRGESWQGKIIEHKRDGSTYPAMLSISPVRDKNGETSHYIAVHEDLTRLEQMENQFRQAQKMESIGTLVGGIAHDFNNLLAAVQGNTYLLKDQLAGYPAALDRVKNIENLSGTASTMIRQLLTFARKDSVAMRNINLNEFLMEAFRLARASIPENIECHFTGCDRPLIVRGDLTQLQQVLMNLLINARDAVETAGEPTIQCKLISYSPDARFRDLHPEITAEHLAQLSVIDNGCGIPGHLVDKVFEPFFSTKETGKGTGLGLAMVYGAINTHGGAIEIESHPGNGTCIHIFLPLQSEEDSDDFDDDGGIIKGNKQTILLVDDDHEMLTVTCEVIESLNYRVLTENNGAKALARFSEYHNEIDLILSDVVMPVMGGIEMAAKVRQIKPGIPIIFATGYDPKHTMQAGGMPENSMFMNKPFNIEELARNIAHLIRVSA